MTAIIVKYSRVSFPGGKRVEARLGDHTVHTDPSLRLLSGSRYPDGGAWLVETQPEDLGLPAHSGSSPTPASRIATQPGEPA
jgi:hypothetical protein